MPRGRNCCDTSGAHVPAELQRPISEPCTISFRSLRTKCTRVIHDRLRHRLPKFSIVTVSRRRGAWSCPKEFLVRKPGKHGETRLVMVQRSGTRFRIISESDRRLVTVRSKATKRMLEGIILTKVHFPPDAFHFNYRCFHWRDNEI